MDQWTHDLALEHVHGFSSLTRDQQRSLLDQVNTRFPPHVYRAHRACLERAQKNAQAIRALLTTATLVYPTVIDATRPDPGLRLAPGCGIVLTAGGEGERLRSSLLKSGVPEERLHDFTKATYPIPGLPHDAGALQVNLQTIRHLSRQCGCEIPVVVTTGPAGSVTARVVPEILARRNNFGLSRVRVIEQDERLHLTIEGKIAWRLDTGVPVPVTNPDETGGPLMKLRQPDSRTGRTVLDWLKEAGCATVLVLQATAVYDPAFIAALSNAARHHDGVGAGIARASFPANDPYGAYVSLRTRDRDRVMIVEQEWRTPEMLELRDSGGTSYLPYNTGFYAFGLHVLREKSLPDYATPPKEVAPGLPRAPKVGYSATDILPLAQNPAVLTIAPESYSVLKNAEDLPVMAAVARRFGIDKLIDSAS